jgi:hypothetical protein
LTQDEYRDSLGIKNKLTDDNQREGDGFWSAKHIIFTNSLQVELYRKYDLRPR